MFGKLFVGEREELAVFLELPDGKHGERGDEEIPPVSPPETPGGERECVCRCETGVIQA